jgi:hypothetical protein
MLLPAHVISIDPAEAKLLSDLKKAADDAYVAWGRADRKYQETLQECATRNGHPKNGPFNSFSEADIIDGHLVIGW